MSTSFFQYQVDSLKSACEQHLSTKLDIESVCEILLLADLHRAPNLKAKCIDYITDHSKQVMATDGWEAVSLNLDLLSALFHQLSLKN